MQTIYFEFVSIVISIYNPFFTIIKIIQNINNLFYLKKSWNISVYFHRKIISYILYLFLIFIIKIKKNNKTNKDYILKLKKKVQKNEYKLDKWHKKEKNEDYYRVEPTYRLGFYFFVLFVHQLGIQVASKVYLWVVLNFHWNFEIINEFFYFVLSY